MKGDTMKIMLYALSTCGWCRKTKQFLDDHKVVYDYVYVDKATGAERDQVLAEVKRWNPALSFPTIVIDDSTVIVGFQEERLHELLKV
jgi:glutaredoxin-like protein NrdH